MTSERRTSNVERRTSKGKAAARTAGDGIARWPRAVREEACRALRDGGTWKAVAAIGERHGFAGINAQNVTNFRKGAYKRWLEKEERMEVVRRESDLTSAVLRHYAENGGSPAEAGLLAASEMLVRALGGIDPAGLQLLLAEKPEKALQVVRSLKEIASFTATRKTSDGDGERKEKTKGFTPESLAEIEKKLSLL